MSVETITAIGGFAAALIAIGGVLLQLARYRNDVRKELREERAELRAEFQPNGGSSMRDAVDKMYRRLGKVDNRQRKQGRELATLRAEVENLKGH